MRVRVVKVNVEPTPADPSQERGYQFDNLALEISSRSFVEGSSKE